MSESVFWRRLLVQMRVVFSSERVFWRYFFVQMSLLEMSFGPKHISRTEETSFCPKRISRRCFCGRNASSGDVFLSQHIFWRFLLSERAFWRSELAPLSLLSYQTTCLVSLSCTQKYITVFPLSTSSITDTDFPPPVERENVRTAEDGFRQSSSPPHSRSERTRARRAPFVSWRGGHLRNDAEQHISDRLLRRCVPSSHLLCSRTHFLHLHTQDKSTPRVYTLERRAMLLSPSQTLREGFEG